MTSDDHKARPQPERPLTETEETLTADHPVYQPPADAEEASAVDASIDGTSASHYGANDPALYEDTPTDKDQTDTGKQ